MSLKTYYSAFFHYLCPLTKFLIDFWQRWRASSWYYRTEQAPGCTYCVGRPIQRSIDSNLSNQGLGKTKHPGFYWNSLKFEKIGETYYEEDVKNFIECYREYYLHCDGWSQSAICFPCYYWAVERKIGRKSTKYLTFYQSPALSFHPQ